MAPVRLPTGQHVDYILCQKTVDLSPRVCTYCMLPQGHPNKCNPDPTTADVIVALYDIQDSLYKEKNHAERK